MIKWFAGAILKLYHQGTYKQQSQHDNNQSNRWSCKEILDKCRKYRNGRRIQCYTWYDRGELPPYHSWCSKLGWMKSIVCMLWSGGTPPVPQLVLQTGMKNEKHWSENPARTWDITSLGRWCWWTKRQSGLQTENEDELWRVAESSQMKRFTLPATSMIDFMSWNFRKNPAIPIFLWLKYQTNLVVNNISDLHRSLAIEWQITIKLRYHSKGRKEQQS